MSDLATDRLLLHPLSAAEAERMLARGPDPAGGYPTDGDVGGARRYLEVCATSGDPRPFGPYVIRLRDGGRTIGGVGFHGAPDEDGTVTIGYDLTASARGHGYASEALRALLGFARERGVAEVRGDTDQGNVASQRVMTAAGMHGQPRVTVGHEDLRCRDVVLVDSHHAQRSSLNSRSSSPCRATNLLAGYRCGPSDTVR